MLTATELAFFASEQAEALKKIKALLGTLLRHATDVATGGPDDPDDNHHRREIRGYLDKIRRQINNLKGKTYDMWSRWLHELEDWLTTTSGEPPVPPTGWF